MNGSQMERDLIHVLRDHGWSAMRSPGSGTGDWPMPDVVAAKWGYTATVELKSGDPPGNVFPQEIDALRQFSAGFWAVPFIGARYSGERTFYLVRPDDLGRTGSARASIPRDGTLLERALCLPYGKGADGVSAGDQFVQDPDRDAETLVQAVAADQFDIQRDDPAARPPGLDGAVDSDAGDSDG